LNRSKSAVSKIQIELANLRYIKTRLVGSYSEYDRIRGGIGIKGRGETKLELDRRNLDSRITKLKRKLKKYEKHFELIYSKRRQFPTVSIVGYTNAGKSSLLNRLCHSHQFSEDLLFSTVDVKSIRFYIEKNKFVIISDTIGFIRDLPHNLIESYKTTLIDIKFSDLLLIVVDITSRFYDDHIKVVFDTLKQIGCENIPYIFVFNKIDGIEKRISDETDESGFYEEDILTIISRIKNNYQNSFFISAKTGEGIEELKRYLKFFFSKVYK